VNYLKPSASILTIAALAMSLSHPLHADVTLDFSSPQNSNENMVLSVIGNRAAVKFVDPSGEQVRMVFDNERDGFTKAVYGYGCHACGYGTALWDAIRADERSA